jgi:hypothetical protein
MVDAAELEAVAKSVAALAPLAPGAVAFFKQIFESHPDPLAQRVAAILPEESESRRVQRMLERG